MPSPRYLPPQSCILSNHSPSSPAQWAIIVTTFCSLLVIATPGIGQIVPDNSLGTENSRITPDSINSIPTDRIDGGAIRGSNLFHSFSEFNIGEGRGAYFANPNGINNIFSRVTGGNISQINGTLGVLGNANLFFINPNGIVFGPNARLDLRGSFLGSTANSILFENGLVFSASNPEAPPLLTVSIPIGLQLRTPPGEAPGALQVNGTGHSLDIANLISAPRSYADIQLDGVNQADSGLQVPPGQTLALIGGEVAINGGILNANDGSIEISSVENGNIRIAPDHDGWTFDYHGVETWGNIRLSQQALFNLNNRGNYSLFFYGDIIYLDNNSLIIGNHPNIYFQAAKLTEIKNSLILSYNSAETSTINQNILDNPNNVNSDNLAGDIITKIDEIPVKPGNITINTGDFRIFEGGLITTTFGAVAGGNLTISARAGAEVDGSFLAATTFGAGRGGDIQVDTKVLSVRNGGGILARTHSEAMTGNISVVATENVDIIGTAGQTESVSKLVVNVAPGATGNGGNLTIETGRLLVVDGGQIATNTAGAGNAGSLNVRSATQVEVIGTGASTQEFTGLFALVEEGATGHGGNLIVETDRLYVKQGGEIGAGTFGIGNGGELTLKATDIIEVAGTDIEGFPANIYTDTLNAGKGGNMTIETRHLSVRDGGQISAGTFGSGQGGNMQIRASETISLAGWARVIPNADNFLDATGTRFPSGLFASTSKNATGNGGNMTLETQELRVIDGAEISASTFGSGGAGNLTLKASTSVILGENRNTTDAPIISLISADTRSSGRGGTLTIETPRLRVADGSQISTRTFGAGPGGALMVKAGESVTLDGTAADGTRSGLFVSVQPLATGAGGTLNLETQRLRVLDGALVEGSTLGDGDAGSVNIRARDTEVIGATPFGASGLFASAVNGSGRGGDLSVVTNLLLIKDGGTIAASNFHSRNLLPPGTGPAGNIQITADSVLLENGASLNALAAVGDKGNMTVNARNIQLRRNSQLNTNAQGTATGGNITINTEILAALEDSNISANAQQSFGGSITINARGIFGAKFRNQQTPDSDITATSELGASFNGTVEINTPAVDPSSGLVTLPENFADIANLIDRDPCTSGGESSFTITGRGGLPPSPTDLLSSNLARSTWIEPPNSEPREMGMLSNSEPYSEPGSSEIILARGWVRNHQGEVVLTSYNPTGETAQRPDRPPNRSCSLK